MKRLVYLSVVFSVLLNLLRLWPVCAQTSSKTSLPIVPITYAGDNEETIIRRAKWTEGAKKEGALVWWSSTPTNLVSGLVKEFNRFYPFIKVTVWRQVGEEIAVKVEAESTSGRHTVDVVLGGEP